MGVLRLLNQAGHSMPSSGLELDLVSNPTGAFLPPDQEKAEERFRRKLGRKWGISFNRLFTFAKVPLGRFRCWLLTTGNYESYMKRLATAFNPSTLDGLMCRSLVSVSWEGYPFDCDFNLSVGSSMGGTSLHISEIKEFPSSRTPRSSGRSLLCLHGGLGLHMRGSHSGLSSGRVRSRRD